ncbi:MAG: response regulator [Byssovorax sp.]
MKRVLIVDDDSDVREALAELFEESYEVLVASNGLEALEVLEEEHADAVLLDLMMPIMDGETFLKKLRESERTVPVVLLSASRDLDLRARTLGATGYCSKPCSAEQVLAAVARVINEPSGGGEQSGGAAPLSASGTKAPPGAKASCDSPARPRSTRRSSPPFSTSRHPASDPGSRL